MSSTDVSATPLQMDDPVGFLETNFRANMATSLKDNTFGSTGTESLVHPRTDLYHVEQVVAICVQKADEVEWYARGG
jgi:hypothetical protein